MYGIFTYIWLIFMVNVGGMYMDPMGYAPIPSAVSEEWNRGAEKTFSPHTIWLEQDWVLRKKNLPNPKRHNFDG